MQPRAAGVDGQRRLVLQQRRFNGELRPRFLEPLDAVNRLQLLDDRFLDDLLARRDAGKLRLDRAAAHGEGGVRRDPRLPGQGKRAIEKLSEVAGRKNAQSQQYAIRGAEPEVGPADVRCVAREEHAAGLNDLRPRSPGLRVLATTTASRPKVEVAIRSSFAGGGEMVIIPFYPLSPLRVSVFGRELADPIRAASFPTSEPCPRAPLRGRTRRPGASRRSLASSPRPPPPARREQASRR